MINTVVLVSGVQQSDSVIRIHVSILFQILFPVRLLHHIEQSSLCCTVGPCWLPILNIAVCTCRSHTPWLKRSVSFASLPPWWLCVNFRHHVIKKNRENILGKWSFYVSQSKYVTAFSLFVFCRWVHLYPSFRFHM